MKQPTTDDFLIVGIGASAGGLEPLEKFFSHVPHDAGMAFAVVQHLAPDHESALAKLLGKFSPMPVEQVEGGTRAAPGRVYIIPPNATLTICDGVFQVKPPVEPRGQRTAIDNFFLSLARDRGQNAVCIMLSGTGSDGTLGLKAIKEYGGMAMAQTLESARYDAILRSAIGTGLVDHILPVEEMPAKLVEYASHLASLGGSAEKIDEQVGGRLAKIHRLLKRRTGHDFSQYKEGTISRRLQRRMRALQIKSVDEYVAFVEQRPEEADQLFKDLLIGVTQFFRDPESFEALAREVVPKLFEGKNGSTPVRACVVGCASGEEAYSLAILLAEHAATLPDPPSFQIFATDIDERGLETARKGRYPESIVEHVSAERLERFFIKQENSYLVKREVRERCIFSNHNFIKDPPFSRLDLISCRNVMIYVGADLQKKMVPLFHYALRRGGYLFLGPSENITELFRVVDKKHRIFQRQEHPRPAVQFPLSGVAPLAERRTVKPVEEDPGLAKQLEYIILQRFRPACVAVRENGDAVYFSGPISRFLEQPTGTPESNVLNMAREGLRGQLRSALHRAASSRKTVEARVPFDASKVLITVSPLTELQEAVLLMVTFEETAAGPDVPDPIFAPDAEETIRNLLNDLRAAQEHGQAAREELETANEELQSANEEYQSTNEELETSKEELQSFNEELETVNAELNRKVAELDNLNSDLHNLLNSTQIATIFLDLQLCIKRFTPAAATVFRLLPGDIGRPITDLAAQFAEGDLEQDLREVLRTLESRERQLTAPRGLSYQMRILPYRTVNNTIEGVVVTFLDITRITESERRAVEAQVYAENIVETMREPLVVLDAELRVRSANRAFYDSFAMFEDSTVGQLFYELGGRQWHPELRRMLADVLPNRTAVKDYHVEHHFTDLGRRSLLLNARKIEAPRDDEPLMLVSINDITESRDELLRLNADLRHIAYATSHDLQEPLRMVVAYTQLLAREYQGKLSPQADQFIKYAVSGALRMETLLSNLREYWSVDDNLKGSRPVDCNSALARALYNLDEVIRKSGALISSELPAAMADETSLTLLFQNLISNAIKFRRPGTAPEIQVTATRDGAFWRFSVADNGIGIDARHLDEIFAPFKRLHTPDDYPGSGLGLAIAKRIVERGGGRIWAESTGTGSTFHFTVPVREGS